MQLCVGISTKNASHNNDLCAMYDKIVNCLVVGSEPLRRKVKSSETTYCETRVD